MRLLAFLLCAALTAHSAQTFPSIDAPSVTESARDDGVSRKVLGSSVVTSVSVIMDTGSEKLYADAVGRPQSKPQTAGQVASPINLLNPDRYEFYTFSDSGDLVKRLMTLTEIQGIIANADGEAFNHNSHNPEKKVDDVVSNVQSVLKGEMEKGVGQNAAGDVVLDTPDVSASWSVILPAIFGNSGEEIAPPAAGGVKGAPHAGMTPDTVVVEHDATTTIAKRSSTTTPAPATTTTTLQSVKVTTFTPTATTTIATTAQPTSALAAADEAANVLERVKHTTSASSQFIQLFDLGQGHGQEASASSPQPVFVRTTPETASSTPRGAPSTSAGLPEGALFVVDEKTNTRTPITTKEQLSSLLDKFDVDASTSSALTDVAGGDQPLITLNAVNGHVVNQGAATTATDAPATEEIPGLDLDRYQQLLLTSTNIYEINKELAKSTTTTTTTTPSVLPLTVGTTPTTVELAPTLKEPNLVDSIEQLIQQAVGSIQEVTGTATTPEEVASTESAPTTQFASTLPDDFLLNEAVGSLLSQVAGADFQGLTTLPDPPSTTEMADEQLEYRAKTTDIFSETTDSSTLVDALEAKTDVTDVNEETTTSPNEILKTDATRYDPPERRATTEVPRTTQVVKDLPVVYLDGSAEEEQPTEQPEALGQTDRTLETVELEVTSAPEVAVGQKNVTDNETDVPIDAESLASTNSYNEVTGNAFESTTKVESDASTLSIDDLIKELTTQGQRHSDAVPKETTVLIITKPLHPTSPPTTTSTTEAPSVAPATTEATWTIVSTISPTAPEANRTDAKSDPTEMMKIPPPPRPVELTPMPQLGGLEETTKHLDADVRQFVALCNELAFGFWKSVTGGISAARSVVVSPFAATSLLAMVFLGARGATSGEMNEILRLDEMVTFNPHLIFKNVSESVSGARHAGVATSVIVRELYSDRAKGHLLDFYKERAKAFYDGHVEEVGFKEIGDVIRRRTNLIVKKLTDGKIQEYVKDGALNVRRPLAGVSASIFQTDCSTASVEGRDGELYFVVLPSIRQRRLVPVPAAVWRTNFLAGYDPQLDATAVSLGGRGDVVATIFVIPGQQGIAAPGDGLARLEASLVHAPFKQRAWSRLLGTLIPRPGLEVHVPRFQHRSVINATGALQQMGMRDLFDAAKADLRGLNGVANDLYLSDMLQINSFATCGERLAHHHAEIYPATANRTSHRRSRTYKDHYEAYAALSDEPRDYQRAFHDPLHDPSLYALPLPLRPRQARLPDAPRLRLDRPFLYFVRHNPTGLILHMGRFNPRLLP